MDRGRPITWQGWLVTVVFFSILIILILYQFLSDTWNTWNRIIGLFLVGSWFFYKIMISLTSENPVFPIVTDKDGVSGPEISKKLNEMKKGKTKF